MNIKLTNEDKREQIIDHVERISEIDILVAVDTGFTKMGNCRMEAFVERKGYKWLGVGKKKKHGGVGFMIKNDIKTETLKQKDGNIGWIKVVGDPNLFLGGVYRSPTEDIEKTLETLKYDIARLQHEGLVIVVGDFNARLGEIPNILNLADPVSNYDRRTEIKRTSEDSFKNRNGKEVIKTTQHGGS